MVFYGILDLIAKPVFCFYHAWSLRNIPYERFMLSSGKASMGYAAVGGVMAQGANGAGFNDKTGRPSTASNAPLAGAGAGGHSAGTGPTNHTTVDGTVGPNGLAPDAAGAAPSGGLLNGRHGLTQRNSHRGAAEAGAL
jgi:hypothetical protein